MWMAWRSRSVTTSWAATRSTASMPALSHGSGIRPAPGLGCASPGVVPRASTAHPPVRLRRDQRRILVDAPRAVAPRLGRAPDRRLDHPDRIAEPGNGRSFLELAAVHAVETDSLRLPGPV